MKREPDMQFTSREAVMALAGRLLIAVLFLPSAVGKIANFPGATGFVASKGLPMPALLLAGAIAVEVIGALALIAGYRTRWAALALAAFTVLAGVLFHDFWAAPAAQAMLQQQAFFKNLGIAGGLLLLAALGPGPLSIDHRKGH